MADEIKNNNANLETTNTTDNTNNANATQQDAMQFDIPDLNPTTSEGVVKLNNWIEAQAKKSAIKSKFGNSKVIIVDKGKPSMWAMKLVFPGTLEAQEILSNGLKENNRFNYRTVMQDAINQGVVNEPKIDNLEDFANTHKSFSNAADQLIDFLADGLSN